VTTRHHAPHDTAERPAVELADGRRLAYVEVGDPNGFPVISCHGGLSSCLDVVPAAAAATARGLRIVSPDRPGIGRSDRHAPRALLDWPADVVALADALGLEELAVLGWSLGGMYAQAVAHALPSRVRAVALVASSVPETWPGAERDLSAMDRTFLRLSGRGAPVDRAIFHVMHWAAVHTPRAYTRAFPLSADDASALTAAIARGLVAPHGVVDDYRVMGSTWGFEPSDLRVPVQIWQGDADDLVPAIWGRRLADAIPDAAITVVPGGTHYLWYEHWDVILDGLAAAVQRAR
jgi:pimeloyl-ACP methyl ester carboxylesterase